MTLAHQLFVLANDEFRPLKGQMTGIPERALRSYAHWGEQAIAMLADLRFKADASLNADQRKTQASIDKVINGIEALASHYYAINDPEHQRLDLWLAEAEACLRSSGVANEKVDHYRRRARAKLEDSVPEERLVPQPWRSVLVFQRVLFQWGGVATQDEIRDCLAGLPSQCLNLSNAPSSSPEAYRLTAFAGLITGEISMPECAEILDGIIELGYWPARSMARYVEKLDAEDDQGDESSDDDEDDQAGSIEDMDVEDVVSIDEELSKLRSMVGLEQVKQQVERMIAFERVNKDRRHHGFAVTQPSRHMLLLGNPGTGKTVVARILSRIYFALGILPENRLVEVDRAGLVGGYLGQTAIRTAEVVESAKGGVLFIDEAYSLRGDSFGQEAVDTLMKMMEDFRSELIVIAAGYEEPMRDFVGLNPGLASRFKTSLNFADYLPEEMLEIFSGLCQSSGYTLSESAIAQAKAVFDAAASTDFARSNARFVRNVFEEACMAHALRVDSSRSGKRRLDREKLEKLDPADVSTAAALLGMKMPGTSVKSLHRERSSAVSTRKRPAVDQFAALSDLTVSIYPEFESWRT